MERPGGTPPRILDLNTQSVVNEPSNVEVASTPDVAAESPVSDVAAPVRPQPPAAWSAPAPRESSASVDRTAFATQVTAPSAVDASEPVSHSGVAGDTLTDAFERALANKPRALRDAYAAIGNQPVWLAMGSHDVAVDRAEGLIRAFGLAPHHALPPARYDAAGLSSQLASLSKTDKAALAAFDIALSEAFLTYAKDISTGLIDPRDISSLMDVDRPDFDATVALVAARSATDMDWLLEEQAPRSQDYAELKRLYNEMLAEAATHDWGPKVPGKRSLRAGDRGDRVGALRDRLIGLGFLDGAVQPTLHPRNGEIMFDEALLEAVKAFQESKGLVVDGIVGANTLSQINMDPTDRIRQVAVNLERARWHNRDLGNRRIVVNIPEYMARLFDGQALTLETRVVVGKPRHQTAEFSGEMTHLVVNPRWNVPYSIATNELLPQLKQDPYALAARNIHIYSQGGGRVDPGAVSWDQLSRGFFPYRLQQSSGRGNALGDVKFMFPNKHSIYLHDTPSKSLFDRTTRAFSHGCVRVARPVDLAAALLATEYSDPAGRYDELSARRGEQYEHFSKSVPVHIMYRTAWLDSAGEMQFRRDIYHRDDRVAEALVAAGVALP